MTDDLKTLVKTDESSDILVDLAPGEHSASLGDATITFTSRAALDHLRMVLPQLRKDKLGMGGALLVFSVVAVGSNTDEVSPDLTTMLLQPWFMTPLSLQPDAYLDFLFKRGLAALHLEHLDFPNAGDSGYPIDIEPYILYGERAFFEIQRRRLATFPKREQKGFELIPLIEAYTVWDKQQQVIERIQAKLKDSPPTPKEEQS